jgi:sugar lactone lactonase YvrE
MADWTDEYDARERVRAVVETLDGPENVRTIAEEADVAIADAKSILDEISGDGGIALRVGSKYDVDLAELERRVRPDIGVCNHCGLAIEPDDTMYVIDWTRYEGSDTPSGSGSVLYCADCAPSGKLSGREYPSR